MVWYTYVIVLDIFLNVYSSSKTDSAAHDHANNDVVAVKKILHVFDNTTSAKRVLREIKLMRHLRHPNLTGIRDLPIALPLLHAYE